MTDPINDSDLALNAGGSDLQTAANQPRKTSKLSVLAFLLALVAIALHFYSDIRSAAERYAGPIPWLPRDLLHSQRLVALQAPAKNASPDTVNVNFAVEELQARLADLTASVEMIGEAKSESAAALQAAREAGSATVRLSGRIDVLQTTVTQRLTEMQASVGGLAEAYSKLTKPSEAPLLAAKLVLLAVNGDLTSRDIEPLSELVGGNPALAETAGRLRALAGEEIPTIAALQSEFNATKDDALQRALGMRLGWMESSLSVAQSALSDIGLIRPNAEEKDEMVMAEAARQIDSGRLGQVLFELQAASPELRQQLTPWMSKAQLRVTFDETLQQLVDGLLTLKVMPPDAPGAG